MLKWFLSFCLLTLGLFAQDTFTTKVGENQIFITSLKNNVVDKDRFGTIKIPLVKSRKPVKETWKKEFSGRTSIKSWLKNWNVAMDPNINRRTSIVLLIAIGRTLKKAFCSSCSIDWRFSFKEVFLFGGISFFRKKIPKIKFDKSWIINILYARLFFFNNIPQVPNKNSGFAKWVKRRR